MRSCFFFLVACGAALANSGGRVSGQEEPVPPGGGPRAASGLLEDAFTFLRLGDYALARETFDEVLAAGSENAAAVRGKAESFVAVGDYDEALKVLESSKVYSSSPVLLAAAGRVHLRRGAVENAAKALRAALALKADHVESLHRLGEAFAKQGLLVRAQETWNQLVEVYELMSYEEAEKLSAADFVELGLALVELNRFREATEIMLQQAEEKAPTSPELLLAYGKVFKEKYNYPDSRDALKEALEQNSKFADAHVLYADNLLTDFQVGTKRYALAAEHLERALEVNPKHAGAYTIRGGLWLNDGNLVLAKADLQKAVTLDPCSLRAAGLLATCHFLQGDEAALASVEAVVLARNPRAAKFFHTIATAIESKFRYRDVVRYCDRALELHSDYWPAFVTLGVNCLRTGDEKRGREFIEKSRQSDKFNPWVFNTNLLLGHMDRNHRTFRTKHLHFKFPRANYDILRLYLAPLLEKAFVRLSARYQVELESPIYIEVFAKHKWFSARTVGLGGFLASGACFGNLVTLTTPDALPQNWGAVAWHEFAHVITLALTHHRVPRWFTEGLSVLEEGTEHPLWTRPFERDIADAFGSGRLLPVAELDFGFSKPKYPNQILISYYQGCLISHYVIEKWGFDAIIEMLKGYRDHKTTEQIFREVLDTSLEDFDRKFLAHVSKWVEANGYEPSLSADVIPALTLQVEGRGDDPEALVQLAFAYYSTGNDVDAVLTSGKVLKLEPENGDAHAVLGLTAYRDEKNPSKARPLLEKSVSIGTRYDYRVHVALGAMARADRNAERAIEYFTKAKQISPRAGAAQSNNLYYLLLELHREKGEEDLAIQQMEELSEFSVEDGKCRRLLADHYLKQDTDEAASKALRALEGLIYIQPSDKRVHQDLARLGERLGEHDATIRAYDYLLTFPDANPKVAYRALAKAHAARGDAAEAVDFARKWLRADPENAEAKGILERFAARSSSE